MYNIETLFTKILRALEGILLGYLFYILKKSKNILKESMFYYSILVSKSKFYTDQSEVIGYLFTYVKEKISF